jgi:hypothetical protein
MTWLVWRQHRKQLLFAVAALVVLAAFFIGTGRPMHDRFERAGLPDCLPGAMEATVVVDLAAPVPAPGPESALPEGVDKSPEPDTPSLEDATLANASGRRDRCDSSHGRVGCRPGMPVSCVPEGRHIVPPLRSCADRRVVLAHGGQCCREAELCG